MQRRAGNNRLATSVQRVLSDSMSCLTAGNRQSQRTWQSQFACWIVAPSPKIEETVARSAVSGAPIEASACDVRQSAAASSLVQAATAAIQRYPKAIPPLRIHQRGSRSVGNAAGGVTVAFGAVVRLVESRSRDKRYRLLGPKTLIRFSRTATMSNSSRHLFCGTWIYSITLPVWTPKRVAGSVAEEGLSLQTTVPVSRSGA